MKYRGPFDRAARPFDPTRDLTRNLFLDAPSGNPLRGVDTINRAVFSLLAAGEDPELVGRLVLGAPKAHAAERALGVADQVVAETLVARATSPHAGALQAILADRRHRWVFAMKASGAFVNVDEIAQGLGVDRASAYRYLAAATAIVTRELRRRRVPA